jgi:hypothetical protein
VDFRQWASFENILAKRMEVHHSMKIGKAANIKLPLIFVFILDNIDANEFVIMQKISNFREEICSDQYLIFLNIVPG